MTVTEEPPTLVYRVRAASITSLVSLLQEQLHKHQLAQALNPTWPRCGDLHEIEQRLYDLVAFMR